MEAAVQRSRRDDDLISRGVQNKTNMKDSRWRTLPQIKSESSRIARKEVRAETQQIKKQSAHYRSQIAALKRQVRPWINKFVETRLVQRRYLRHLRRRHPPAVFASEPKALQRIDAGLVFQLPKRVRCWAFRGSQSIKGKPVRPSLALAKCPPLPRCAN